MRGAAPLRPLTSADEATSALDAESARNVTETINSVKAGRTTIIVTHKLEQMRAADRLIVLDHGRIVETGSFDELVRARGHFSALASAGEWESAS